MAGRGFPPKDPQMMSRPRDGRRRQASIKDIVVEPARQPTLPRDIDWHPRTRAWWREWKRWPLAETFTAADWSFLLDTALMHHRMWAAGEMKWASEIRLRVAKFGMTPEDRQRLRLHFSQPNEGNVRPLGRRPHGSDGGQLRAVPDGESSRPPLANPLDALRAAVTESRSRPPAKPEGDPSA